MMEVSKDLIQKIELLSQGLLDISSQLLALAKESAPGEVIADLQEEQEKVLKKLVKIDKEIELGSIEEANASAWKRISKRLAEFQELNSAFIESLSVRQGLIQFQVSEIQSSKKTVAKLKKRYRTTNKSKGGRKGINRLQ